MGKTLTALILVCSLRAHAEGEIPLGPVAGPVESAFKTVEHPWLTAGVLEFPFYWFYVGAPAIRGSAYLPNFLPRLGAKVTYKDMGAQVTLGLPVLSDNEKRRRGDSTQSGLALNSYWRQNAFDLYFQRFKGFYVSDPFTETRADKPDRYPQLPDTSVTNVGFNWYFNTRPERYSLKAAFDQNEFQLKSGGSWIYNPFLNHLEMFLGSQFIPGTNSSVTSLPNLASGRFETLGMALGYGYTYIASHFFATAQGALGPGYQFQRIRRADGNKSEVSTVAGKMNVNLAAGWNYPEYVGGMKVLVDSLYSRVVDTQVTSSMITIQFFFGQRF